MTYTQQGDRVTLEMTRDDYERLLIIIGFACGAAMRDRDDVPLYSWLQFTNELNAGNPKFRQYEIPERFRREPV